MEVKHNLTDYDGCITTFTGKKFSFIDPTTDMFDIKDIAKGLANTPHFGGQTDKFFSVAQHSIMVMQLVEDPLKKVALLHDGAEAYMGDCLKPLKLLLPAFKKIEIEITGVMFKAFGLDIKDLPKIKPQDLQVQEIEYDYFFRGNGFIKCWTPEIAYHEFMNCYTIHYSNEQN